MQRVYGTAFFSQKELDEHVTRLEEAKKRDHRKLGKELGLFTFHPARRARASGGQGRDALQHARRLHARQALPRRLQEVKTPIVYNKELWDHVRATGRTTARTCSWWSRADGDEMGLKAMNCPGHYLLYRARSTATARCRSASTSRRRSTATKRRACSAG